MSEPNDIVIRPRPIHGQLRYWCARAIKAAPHGVVINHILLDAANRIDELEAEVKRLKNAPATSEGTTRFTDDDRPPVKH